MFLDEATITVQGGTGGRGCVSWRREKYEPMGGPDGGDGGDGGSVIIEANDNTDTLSFFVARKRFGAENGSPGSGNNRGGKNGEDLVLLVPPGTQVITPEALLSDLRRHGDRLVAARGGRGGYGNAHFVSSTRQAPDFAEVGEPGQKLALRLELKLVADVGIIGFPNVGKSTFIASVSAARPKIADYAFTTLVPNLGVTTIDDRSIVLCDVPGLIEGASEGKGLGHAFLRHIERCGVLLHLLDLSRALQPDGSIDVQILQEDYRAIRHELQAYSPTLAGKPEIVAISKCDLTMDDLAAITTELQAVSVPVEHCISSATGKDVDKLLRSLLSVVFAQRASQKQSELTEEAPETEVLPTLRPGSDTRRMNAYTVKRSGDELHVSGERLQQFTAMTDFHAEGGRERFNDVLQKIGLHKEIQRALRDGAKRVYIGTYRVDTYL